VLLLVPAAFLLWAVCFVVRQVYYRKVIAFERFDRQSRVEAATGLRAALRRRRGRNLKSASRQLASQPSWSGGNDIASPGG